MDTARDLADRLASLLRREQGAMADFLLALADFDRSRSWLALGYTSLFYFLHRALKLSAGAAYHRKTAAELLQRCPEVIEPLRDGRLCLSSVVELARVMTVENAAEVLPRFFHASKQEARAVAAELAPRDVLPARVVVTALPPARAAVSAPSPSSPALDLEQPFHPGEVPHIVPVGRGGRSTASQMRTLCKFHNDLAAREVYGDELMDRFTRGAGRPPAQHAARQP
jgi:hypothetical protein